MAEKSRQEGFSDGNGLAGFDFKAQRESRGLALEDVSRVTKISTTNLEAIEKEEFYQLPPSVYAKAYIKSYARLIDADENKALVGYEKYLKTANNDAKDPEPAPRGLAFPFKKLMIGAGLLIALCIVFSLIYLYSDFHDVSVPVESNLFVKPQPTVPVPPAVNLPGQPQANVVPAATNPPVQPQTNPAPATANLPLQPLVKPGETLSSAPPLVRNKETVASGAASRLLVKAREKTWVKVREEGKPALEMLMKPGDILERTGAQFNLDVGNAGGVSIEFRGKLMENLGKSGEVVHLSLPPMAARTSTE